jgi:undecaprenyl phosphate N,N'-diacetylbacillosamine 1-phosphate transferase
MYAKCIKRILDFVLSLIAIIVLSPIYLLLMILVRAKLGKPVFFTQDRIGKNEEIFKLYKFRSMTDARDGDGKLLPDEIRLTSFGKKLRSSSLDELPELFNIIKGDMSIIGPRPLLPRYLPYFKPEERVRHKVRGGLVPPEVLSGKTHTTWDEQFAIEREYANSITFLTDIRIIIATIKVVFKRVNSNFGGDVRKPLDEERAEKE